MSRGLWLKLDPRVQLVMALSLSVVLLFLPFPKILIPVILCWFLALGTLPSQSLRPLLKSVVFLSGVTVMLGAWLSGDRSGVQWFEPTWSGTRLGGVQALRVSALGAVMAWLVSLLSVWRLSQSLEWSLRGIPAWRLRFHRLAFPFVLAWSMIPGLWDETQRQIEVYRLRRGPKSPSWNLNSLRTLIPGWFHGMAQRAETLSEALVLRGYRGEEPPRLTRFRLSRWDFGSLAALLGVLWISVR